MQSMAKTMASVSKIVQVTFSPRLFATHICFNYFEFNHY